MKQKIYKVLGIVLTMAIIMSTCVCAVWNVSAETTITFAQGTIDNGEVKSGSTDRVHTPDALAKADYESVTIADGWKAYFHFYGEDDSYLGNAGAWATGLVTVNTASMPAAAVYFRVVIGEANNAAITPETLPADAVTFTEAPKLNPTAAMFALGNVNTNTGKFVLNGTVTTRATTKNLLKLADYDKVTLKDGWKAWFYAYKSDGETLSDTTGNGTWATGTFSLSTIAGLPDATYFSITIATANNDTLVIKDIPEDVITLTEAVKLNPTAAMFVMGTIDGSTGKVSSANHRAYLKDALAIADYEKVTIASDWKAYFQYYDAEDNWLKSSGAWLTDEVTTASMPKDATHFRFTIAKAAPVDNAAFELVDIAEDTVVFTEAVKLNATAALFVMGTIDGSTGKVSSANHRAYLKDALAIADYEKVTIASGWKAYFQYYDAEDNWLKSSGAWLTEEVTTASMPKDATHFRFTIAKAEPEDNAEFELVNIAEDTVVFTEAVACEHAYDNDCDADCNLCGEIREVADHVYENYTSNNDATCTANGTETGTCVCGATDTREDADSKLDHVYENYTSNNDATCTANGTETGTCVCGATDTREDADSKLDHTYENYTSNNDATCTANGTETGTCVCGATDTREVANSKLPHSYDDEFDADCNVCGYIRDAACRHEYDNACDNDCNLCGEVREVPDHVYDNDCDADCNVCGDIREVADHVYDNACDTDCNVCGEVREVGDHVYDNACDTDCNNCGLVREVPDHVYDNACDADCNECGEVREVADHVYDNACDADCNVCGATREVADHVYDNACDKDCNVCGDEREVGDHVYNDIFDADCNECGAIREVPDKCDHEYDNLCDAECNLCFEIREVGDHKYNTDYDVDCNNCGFIREAEAFSVVEFKEVDGKEYIFVDGRTAIKGLFKINGDYYFSDWGGEIVRDKKAYVKISYCDLPGGKEYTFGADGKLLNGFVEKDGVKYLYFNGITATKGIYKIDGDYYFSDWGGVVKGGTFYTSYIFTEDLTPGEYTFDEEGKMVNGFVEKDGEKVLYVLGKVAAPGLHEVDGKYYVITWNGVVRTNGTYFVKESFCGVEANRNLEVGLDGVVTNI